MNENTRPMTDDEQYLDCVLQGHHGRGRAVTAGLLARARGTSEVAIRMAAKGLTEDFGRPIASATSDPAGFFIPETEDEARHYLASLVSRIRSMARRVKAAHDAYRHANLLGADQVNQFVAAAEQMHLDLEEQQAEATTEGSQP